MSIRKKGVIMENTLKKLERNGISIKYEDIVRLCEKYHISELSVFGSAIRDDFRDESDIDILVTFENLFDISIFDLIDIESEFAKIVNRKAQVVIKESLKNPIRKKRILSTREVVYVA